MNTLQINYQAVIEHIADDINVLRKSGQIADAVSLNLLQKRHDWLVFRRDRLNEQREQSISRFKHSLETYLYQCERFWKSRHERTYEKKIDELFEVKQRVVKIYALTGFDACYALSLTLKYLRAILPLKQYPEHAPALAELEAIKEDCYGQLRTYL
jgi:hypothetical protein